MQRILSKLFLALLIVLAALFVLPRFIYELPRDSTNSGVYFSKDKTSCYLMNINNDKDIIVYANRDGLNILFKVISSNSQADGDLYSCEVLSQNNTNLVSNDSYDVWIKRINDTCFKINGEQFYKARLKSKQYYKGINIYNDVIISAVRKGDIK